MFGDKDKNRVVSHRKWPASLAAVLLALGTVASVGAVGDFVAPARPVSYLLSAPALGETDQAGLADENLAPDFFMGPGAKDDRSKTPQKVASRIDGPQKPFDGALGGNEKPSRRYGLFSNGDGSQLYASREKNRGWGIAVEQKLFGYATLFARHGRSDAFTVGAKVSGAAWDRSKDHIGLVVGRNEISGIPIIDTGAGQPTELYYSRQVSGDVRVVSSLQQAGGSATVSGGSSTIWLRALMPF